ncbi:MAG: hypothetical protein MJ252_01100, partial [archaeon]|nr:hypothetical protein [archaeon]
MSEDQNKKVCEYTLELFSKLHTDYLLLERISYKTKNQFRRHRHYQYAHFIKKSLKKMFNIHNINVNNKTNTVILDELIKYGAFDKEKMEPLINHLIKLGLMIQEMLKLKLYLSYSLLLFGIVSRIY